MLKKYWIKLCIFLLIMEMHLKLVVANLDIALSFAPTDFCARTLNSLTCSLVKCPCEFTLSRFAMHEASSYIDNVYAIKVPKGTTIYTGPVGPQGGVYVGGYNVMQTYMDAPWTFEVVGKTPLQ